MLQKIPYDLAEIYRYLTGNYGLCETRPQEIMKKITPCSLQQMGEGMSTTTKAWVHNS